jgi:hypothetical protein
LYEGKRGDVVWNVECGKRGRGRRSKVERREERSGWIGRRSEVRKKREVDKKEKRSEGEKWIGRRRGEREGSKSE